MRKLGRQLLAGPYLVWIIGFILLPIVIILYYAFTNTSGAFTWDNIAAIADPETSCQGLFHQIHKKSTKKVPEAPYGS